MVEQVKAMRSAITKKPERKPPFYRGGASTNVSEGVEPRTSAKKRGHTQWGKATLMDRKELRVSLCLSKYVDNSNGAHGRKTSGADKQPAASRKIKESHKHLEGDNKRHVGAEHHKGLSCGLPLGTPAECTTSHSTVLCGTESISSGGGTGTSGQRSHSRSTQPSGRVLLKPVPSPEEGRWTETGDKPKSSEQFSSHRAFQDGGNPYLERPSQSGGLVGESRSKGCIFRNPNSHISPQILEV